MVDTLSLTFSALADPTRRAILARLASGEATVMDTLSKGFSSEPRTDRTYSRACTVLIAILLPE